jgi:hypothetical protein
MKVPRVGDRLEWGVRRGAPSPQPRLAVPLEGETSSLSIAVLVVYSINTMMYDIRA